MDEIDRKAEAQIISDERSWSGETLCLKRLPKPGEKTGVMGYAAFGIITSSQLPISVWLRPNFAREQLYDTVDALLDDGWITD